MPLHEEHDDEEDDFEWKEEDEDEVPEGKGEDLSRINRIAPWVFLGLMTVGVIYFLIRFFGALREYFGG